MPRKLFTNRKFSPRDELFTEHHKKPAAPPPPGTQYWVTEPHPEQDFVSQEEKKYIVFKKGS